MITAIVRFSIRFPGVVVALALMMIAYGIFTLQRARVDVFPEFSPTQVVIQTEAAGLSSELVETAGHAADRERAARRIRRRGAALAVDPRAVGGHRAVRGRLGHLPQSPGGVGAHRGARQPHARGRGRAGDHAAHVLGEHRARDRPHLEGALAHGIAQPGRRGAAPAPAGGRRRGRGQRLRRPRARMADPGRSASASSSSGCRSRTWWPRRAVPPVSCRRERLPGPNQRIAIISEGQPASPRGTGPGAPARHGNADVAARRRGEGRRRRRGAHQRRGASTAFRACS